MVDSECQEKVIYLQMGDFLCRDTESWDVYKNRVK